MIIKGKYILFSALTVIGLLVGSNRATADNFPRKDFEYNQPGNILIADQFNNRVIEITPDGQIVWSFGLGPNDF